jgi:hypothetical protein
MHKSRNYFKTALNEITLHFLILAWFPSEAASLARLRLTSSLSDDDSTYTNERSTTTSTTAGA